MLAIKITVDGKQFDSVALAQEYIDAQDPVAASVAAFGAYKKANGAQRLNLKLVEEYARWVDQPETPTTATSAESTLETTEVQEEQQPVQTASDNATDDDLNAEAPSLGKSAHVTGPDENRDDDPLAGLDI